MREQLRRAGTPAPTAIGIDEISIRKGHTYRIVVSDLVRGRPIWFGGHDRSEASMDLFFSWLGPRKCRKIRLPSLAFGGRGVFLLDENPTRTSPSVTHNILQYTRIMVQLSRSFTIT